MGYAALESETGTKWPPLCRQHLQMHFHEWRFVYSNSVFTEICTRGSNYQYTSNGWDGLATNRRQTIFLTNAGLRLKQNVRHFADDTFKCISLKENINYFMFFTEICFLWSNCQYGRIGSDNGLLSKGSKPLSQSKLIRCTDANMRRSTSMS